MSDESVPSLAEALAEIRRLRAQIHDLEGSLLAAEYRRQAEIAAMLGTLEKPAEDEPSSYTHNVPPTAPPHDE